LIKKEIQEIEKQAEAYFKYPHSFCSQADKEQLNKKKKLENLSEISLETEKETTPKEHKAEDKLPQIVYPPLNYKTFCPPCLPFNMFYPNTQFQANAMYRYAYELNQKIQMNYSQFFITMQPWQFNKI
jgi:hypothetical protein